MKITAPQWISLLCLLATALLADCGYRDPVANVDGAGSRLRTQRQGREGGCLFTTREGLQDSYACTPMSVIAGASTATGLATLILTPAPGQATSASGMVQFGVPAFRAGKYGLSDLRSAAFSITRPSDAHPAWLCQSGAGAPTLGDLRLELTSARMISSLGSDIAYEVHGVFEALLIPASAGASREVVLHGEF